MDELLKAMKQGYDDAIHDFGKAHDERKQRNILAWPTNRAVVYTMGYESGWDDAEIEHVRKHVEAK